jgi:hypothetical protein
VMAADRPYDEFYDFYSVSPEYFVYHHVHNTVNTSQCPTYFHSLLTQIS